MPTGEETARLLAHTEVFMGLEPRELLAIAQVAVPRHWDRGEIIFREGDTGDTCYLLRSGAVVLTREHQDGRMVALAELRGGALFGELAMFRGETRSATAEAIEPCSAVALLAGDVQRLVKRNPDLALKLLATLAERVSRTNERPARPDGLAPGRGRTRGGRADPRDPGRDRPPGRHLPREREPVPRHAGACRRGHPGTGKGHRA
jgi:CRP-like cAMP-binding protein